MMPPRSASSLRVGLAVALVSAGSVGDVAAQSLPPPPPRTAAPPPTIGVPSHRQSFPVGLAVGLGVGLGLAILGGILNSRASSDEPDGSDQPPREPVVPPPPTPGPKTPSKPRVRVAGAVVAPQTTTHGGHHGSGAPRLVQAPRPGFVIPPSSERRYAPDEVLLTTKGTVSPAALRRLEAALRLTPVTVAHVGLLDADVRRYRLAPGASVAAAIRALRGQTLVAEAEPNFVFELQDDPPKAPEAKPDKAAPVDAKAPAAPVQYAVAALHLEEAHRLTRGDEVRVAIIDSGIDDTSPELKDAIVERFDAVGGTFAAQAHGTAMAGAIVAHQTLVGAAPKARLIAIRAFAGAAARGTGSGFDVLRGLDFAAAHAARIINMSFAGPRDMLVGQALAAARERGIVAIAAAGNAGPAAKPLYPGAEDGVIAVTATDAAGKPFAQANRGAYVAVAAPGVDVIAPGLGGAVQISTGTSIACAEASGVAALVLARRPNASPEAVRKMLTRTARPLPDGASATGAGLLDAAAAVNAAR